MKNSKNIIISTCLLLLSVTILSCSSLNKSTKKTNKKAASELLPISEQRQFTYYFYEAIRQRELKNYDKAIELLTKCYHINSSDGALMAEFSGVYSAVGNIDLAITYMSEAVAQEPENLWYKINLAELFRSIDDLKTTTEIYESAIKTHPEKDEINYNLLDLYLKQNRTTDAIEVLNRIEKHQGINEEISFEKYRIYANLGDNKKASKEIDMLIDKYPQEMKYKILRGNIYFENNEKEKAFQLYTYVLSKEPENALALLSMADYYEKTNEKEKAIQEMDIVLRSKNIDIETKLSTLDKYLSQIKDKDDWEKRVPTLFQALLEMHPDVVEIHNYYASYLISLNKPDEALKEYELMIKLDPKYLQAWTQSLDIKLHQGKMEDIIDISNKAIINLPEYPQWFFYQGIAFFQLKKYDESISAYEKGLVNIKEDNTTLRSDFYGQMADVYYEKKDKEKAFNFYEKSLESNPTNVQTLNNYSYYLSIEKQDLSKAETMIKKCIELAPNRSTFLDTYAWVLFQQGYYNLAKRYIEEALKYSTSPDNVIVEHYGDILSKTENKEQAIIMWKKAVELGNKSENLLLKIEKGEYIE